ncbi:glutathione S-transferase family protein [Pseudomonas petrae]|uniref:Glutathione S-transferase family protein n=1 Tax=Pseudomonas petrae TaxID=2912190 RepID=A0ABS9I921_9PSED|nr:glutathione S-transferase family protein [Pseudomonas petrae]MCF7530967.1 glutathione S-transferase family protein [Pseudomonas petrae]MCF7536641.1 glutathione S-transferase family protein [Pseudomonas petrae]MCF7544252.1 glutathione S-transferase family protein [Pseudomonas petrae]MCF7554321.1 glutathione S-transferase family protein [Pseudomonas petrae]
MSLTLYGFDGSPYVRTVKMLLKEKNAEFDQLQINVMKGEPHHPDHLVRHAFGKVPVIEHDGFRVIETSAIMAYLDEVLPGVSLTPDNARDRARANMAQAIYDSYGYGSMASVFGYYLFPDFIGGQNDESRLKGIQGSKLVLTEIMKLKGSDPYIAGKSLSVGDLYLAPACAYLAMTPDADEVFAVTGFETWWASIQSLPSFKTTPPQ